MQQSTGLLPVHGSTGTTLYVPHSGTAIKSLHLYNLTIWISFNERVMVCPLCMKTGHNLQKESTLYGCFLFGYGGFEPIEQQMSGGHLLPPVFELVAS